MQHDDEPQLEPETTFDLAHLDELPAAVAFGEHDNPLFEIAVYTPPAVDHRRRIDLDSEQRAAISGILVQAPALIQSGYIALNTTFRLSFAPGVADKMAKIMQAQGGGLRATALNPQGKIIGNGVLTPTNGMRAIAATTAVWQTLSIITAQVHLAEINARLAKIERGVDEIRAILEADLVSKVEIGLRYVREAATALGRRDLSEPERQRIADQLEHIWRDCGQVARTVLVLMNRAPSDFGALPLSAVYRLGESADLAREAISTYERRAHAYLMAEYVRCATIALRTQLELSPGVSEHRLDELRGDLADWRDSVKVFYSAVNRHVNTEMSAWLYKQATIDAERRRVVANARERKRRLKVFCAEIEQLSHSVRQRVQAQKAGTTEIMTVIVTLDERGQIAETFQVPNPAQEPVLNSTRGQRDD